MSFDSSSRLKLVCRVTRVVICLVIAGAVALTQSSPNVHAEASIIQSWSHQMEAEPKQLGSTSLNGLDPYSPYKIKIDSVEARGQLNVEENEEHFLLNKGNKLVLEIPKYEEFGIRGFKISGDRGRVLDETLPIDERVVIDHIIKLSSNNPDVSLCRYTPRLECKTEITTNVPRITVRPQGLEDLAKAAGVFDQDLAANILSLDLDGKIDGEQFLVMGRVIYDNTEQSRMAYKEKTKRSLIRWVPGKIVPLAFAILLIVPFVWLGMKKSRR